MYRKINEDVWFKIFCLRNEYYILKLYIKLFIRDVDFFMSIEILFLRYCFYRII